jgi:putative transposase
MLPCCRDFAPGRIWFFTVALADPRAALLTERIDALGAAFRQCRATRPFATLAIAVMPAHLHCVWRLPDGDADTAVRWSLIKRAFTRRQYHEGPTPARTPRGLWQPRFRERAIADAPDLQRHIDYVHFNPVVHGLAPRAADWPHSSFHRCVRRGWLPLDWASDAAGDNSADFGE